MGEETITVGSVSRGDEAGTDVELPIVDLLTGRGFITGKSGSGKSNSASVIAEKLLDRGYSLLAVDIDGEYYGLKEEYEILHVGGDEECDLVVSKEHAGKIAELALEQNVPIILDISSFLDESEARALLTEVTKHLFAKEKKMKQPFLMLVEEVHEYIPEGGGMDECGRMLIKVGKRGRKHGLGIVGISQRPADVKKDFITQCDWLVWHRLTWNNDTKVVGRILGSEYADHIEEMDDGECFLMTDWAEQIRVVQFERKQTFDAGATPGLDDFERPELKSVSGDLVEELQEISEEQEHRENRIEELQRELKKKDERIQDLERQLADAQDLKQMADRFSRAMMEQVTGRPLSAAPGRQSELEEAARRRPVRRDPELEAELDAIRNGEKEPQSGQVPDASDDQEDSESVERSTDETETVDGPTSGTGPDTTTETREVETEPATATTETGGESEQTSRESTSEAVGAETNVGEEETQTDTEPTSTMDAADAMESTDFARTDGTSEDGPFGGVDMVGGSPESDEDAEDEPTVAEIVSGEVPSSSNADDPLVARLREEVRSLDGVATEMLRYYRDYGPTTPQEAHSAAGNSGDRTEAYAANRTLRQRGLVEHVGRGSHDYALPALVTEESRDPFNPNERLPEDERDRIVRAVEAAFVEGVDAPGVESEEPDATAATDGGTGDSDADGSGVSDETDEAAGGRLEPWPDD